MDEFNPIKEICAKIAAAAETIADYEESIIRFENHGEQPKAEAFIDAQSFSLEQLQRLTLMLTGVLIPEQEEEFEEDLENLDESEGGSVFMAGELDDKLGEIDAPEYEELEEEEDE